jgi:hypothetical protein
MISAMPKTQSAASHIAWDPLYHFILVPLTLINLGLAIYGTCRSWPFQRHLNLGWILVSLLLAFVVTKLRTYPLQIQNRVIRLEERMRIAALAPAADAYKLSTQQLIALRFASDAELPALVARTLAENLDPKAIKEGILTWRPDYARI